MHRLPVRPRVLVTATGAVLLGLTGCAGPVLGVLEREPTEQDALTIRTDLDGIDLDSTRLLAERDGVEYFVATPSDGVDADPSTVCLLVEEGIGVGLECAPLRPGSPGAMIRDSRVTAVLLPDSFNRNGLTEDGYELLHPNLALRPAEPE